MPKTMSRLSKDDILVPVRALLPDGQNPDPTSDTIQFQFVPGGLPPRTQPVDADWFNGFWSTVQGGLLAGITIGPGTPIVLTKGPWAVWLKIEDSPTIPVAAVDTLWIY